MHTESDQQATGANEAASATEMGWDDAPLNAFMKDLKAGARLALFMRIDAGSLRFSWGQLLGISAFAVALALAFERFYVGTDGYFYKGALPDYFFIMPTIFGAWMLSCLGQRKDTGLILLASVTIFPLLVLIGGANVYLYQHLHETNANVWLLWFFYYLITIWYTLAVAIAGIRLAEIPRRHYVSAFAAAAVALALPTVYIDNDSWLWSPNYSPSSSDGDGSFKDKY